MLTEKHSNKVALITGGTKGIGLATALRFAKEGYQCVITYNWGSAEDEKVIKQFKPDYLPPHLVQANVINSDDTQNLLEQVHDKYGPVDVFISNVSFANVIKGLDDYSEKSLYKSIEYSTWPMIEYTKQMKQVMGDYPKYVIGISSHGPDVFHKNYDFAAVVKSLSEVLVRYLNYHFFNQQVIFLSLIHI